MTISNISSKATGPIVAEFHTELPWADGRKIYQQIWSHDQHGRHAFTW